MRWGYSSHLVGTVYEYRDELISVFRKMTDPDEKWDQETYIAARGFEITMQDFDFSFILNTFANIFPLTDCLVDILQAKIHDIWLLHK